MVSFVSSPRRLQMVNMRGSLQRQGQVVVLVMVVVVKMVMVMVMVMVIVLNRDCCKGSHDDDEDDDDNFVVNLIQKGNCLFVTVKCGDSHVEAKIKILTHCF